MPTNRWAVLALLCFARIGLGFQFQSVPPLAPFLVAELGYSHSQIGLLVGLFLLPGSVLALVGGALGARFGDKAGVLAGLALMVAGGALFAESRSFAPALVGRMLSGGGVVLLTALLTKVAAEWFAGKEIATAMSLLLATWPLGIASAFAMLGHIAAASSWQGAVWVTVALPLAAFAAMALLYPPLPGAAAAPVPAIVAGVLAVSGRELALVLVLGLAWVAANASYVLQLTALPALLIERGSSPASVATLVSISPWVGVAVVPLAGVFVDRLGRKTALVVFSSLAGAACMAMQLTGQWVALWLVAASVLGSPGISALISLLPEALRPDNRGVGFGIFFTQYYLGIALLTPIGGLLQDLTGGAAASLVFGAALMALAAPILLLFRALQRRLPLAA
jgi:predicted MFS family arabinose efflux permease